ncbi:MAG TPA: Mov34/MPN/PAD-1 family protein [Verrucomicrobiae bacterium]|nr:Mov34/MPN/PAD-1 family protein [Verrucomicrobiae bacterium]
MKFSPKPLDVLRVPEVREALGQAWKESQAGLVGGHEEGGFVVLEENDKLNVQRWPMGEGARIKVPVHAGCVVDGLAIVATFHTHPNTGPEFLQEPSETDRRGVRDDANLKGAHYIGEFVIADEMVYLVTPSGAVREVDRRTELLG